MEQLVSLLSKFGNNLALALSLTLLYSQVRPYLGRSHLAGLVTGLLFGGAALPSILVPVRIEPGISFDACSVFVALSAPFGGRIASLTAAAIAASHGIWLPHDATGIGSIATGLLAGNLFRHWVGDMRSLKRRMLLPLGLIVGLSDLLWQTPRLTAGLPEVLRLGLPMVCLLYPLGTLFMGIVLSYEARRHESAAALEEEKERLDVTLRSIGDAVISTDARGDILLVNQEAESLTGYGQAEVLGRPLADVFRLDPNKSANGMSKGPNREGEGSLPLHKALHSGIVAGGTEVILIRRDGRRLPVGYIISSIKAPDEHILGVVLVFRDITGQIESSEKLITGMREKEVLLREIHHRVKNNLQVVYSLLDYQAEYVEDTSAGDILRQSRDRIRSMALIHEQLYESGDLGRIDIAEYVENLVLNLKHSFGPDAETIDLQAMVDSQAMGLYSAIPCGLIINELVSNALKHAFPNHRSASGNGNSGRVEIVLSQENGRVILVVSDNGAGFPRHLDFRGSTTMGLQLVNMLTRQLKGEIEMVREQGTEFRISFEPAKLKRNGAQSE